MVVDVPLWGMLWTSGKRETAAKARPSAAIMHSQTRAESAGNVPTFLRKATVKAMDVWTSSPELCIGCSSEAPLVRRRQQVKEAPWHREGSKCLLTSIIRAKCSAGCSGLPLDPEQMKRPGGSKEQQLLSGRPEERRRDELVKTQERQRGDRDEGSGPRACWHRQARTHRLATSRSLSQAQTDLGHLRTKLSETGPSRWVIRSIMSGGSKRKGRKDP